MIIDEVKRNVMQNGIRLGIVHSNRVQRIKNFVLEKKSSLVLHCIKFCSDTSYKDSLKMYYDFKKYLVIMKALRIEIKERMLIPTQTDYQSTIDDMSLEYKTTMQDLLGLYLLKCKDSGFRGEYDSSVACEQASQLIKRNKYMNQLLQKNSTNQI